MAQEKLEIIISAVDQASGPLRNVAGLAGGLAAAGFGALAAEIGLSVKAAMDSEQVVSQLNATLESTHGVAGITSQAAQDLATSLQGITRFSDEAVLGGENLLLTFTNIGKDIFPDATTAMLDMSTALGQDVKSSAIQLGKALQDPILGVSALRRVGVNFNEQQQDLIKSMVESGNVAEAQKYILKELQTEFGGSAEAAGKTFAGQLDILRNKFDDVQEKIGGAFIPVLLHLADTLMPYIDKYLPVFADFLINQVAPAIDTAITFLGNLMNDLQNGTGIVGQFNDTLAKIVEFIRPVISGFQDFVSALQSQMPAAKSEFDGIAATVTQVMGILGPQFQALLSELVTTVGNGLRTLAAFWREHGDTIMAIVGTAIRIVATIISVVIQEIIGIVRVALAIINGDWRGAWEIFKTTFANIWNTILALFGTSIAQIQAKIAGIGEGIKTSIQDALNFIGGMVSQFQQFGSNIVQGIIDGINAGAGALIDTIIQIVNDTVTNVLNALQIGSPSRVFANIGLNTMAGMQQGIAQGGIQVQRTMQTVTNSVMLAGQGGDSYSTRFYGPVTQNFPNMNDPEKFLRGLNTMSGT